MVFSLGIHTFDLSSLVLTNAGNKKTDLSRRLWPFTIFV